MSTARSHDGRSAIVTGGASGIGRAVATMLAEEGAVVVVVDRDEALLLETCEIIEAGGGRARALAADVTDLEALSEIAATIETTTGSLDVLVTSAGIQRYGDVVETSLAEWNEVFSVNVTGVFTAAKATLPSLRRSGSGAIVVVSSVQAYVAQNRVAAYSASKGALNALTRAMAIDEASHGVRVNSVSPGSVDTPMLHASAERFARRGTGTAAELLQDWGRAHPLGRLASPRDVAAVVSFLASDAAAFVTGEDVRVDGGLLAVVPVVLPSERG